MSTHRIEVGQEYERHDPRENSTTRIRVLGQPTRDYRGGSAVWVATLTPDGREIRARWIATRQLHDDPNRRTGYRLVTPVDGAAADGAQQ